MAATDINLAIARVTVRGWLRSNGYDTTLYTDAMIDQALADCGEEVARKTILLRRNDTISLTTNVNTISGLPTNFRPDRLCSAYLFGNNVSVSPWTNDWYTPITGIGAPVNIAGFNRATLDLAPYEQVLEQTYAMRSPITNGTSSPYSGSVTLFQAQPQKLAFQNRTGVGIVFPCPDQEYSVQLLWNDLFVASPWVVGTQGAWSSTFVYNPGDVVEAGSSGAVTTGTLYQALTATNTLNQMIQNVNIAPSSNASTWLSMGAGALTAPAHVTFNLVNDYLRPLLLFGAPSRLQYNEPLGSYAVSAKTQWENFIKDMSDRGDLGENYYQRTPINRWASDGDFTIGGGYYGGGGAGVG